MRRTLGIVCAGLIGLLTLSPSSGGPETATRVAESSSAPAATPVVPAQFVAKMYTEALGRHPDPGGWAGWLDAFARAGCSTETTSDVARRFFTSGEFLSRGYDNPARVLALYRGALNREPDQGGFDHWTGQLDRAMTWPQLVDLFVGSAEFARLAAVICGSSTSYAFGTHPAPTLPVTGPGFAGGTGAELQAVLDSTPAGGTVQLAQKAVVRLDATLDGPRG